MSSSPPFTDYLRALGRGPRGRRDLSRQEARDAMRHILQGNVDDLQLGAFLLLLRVKEETPEEIAGFVEAGHDVLPAPPDGLRPDLDWPSYAGKARRPNAYALAALTLADAGYRVLLHGTRGHTPGRCYTHDLFAALGLPVASDWSDTVQALDTHRLAYLPVAALSPALERLLNLKPTLGLRTVANTLVRLLNPGRAPHTLSSVFHPNYGPLQARTLQTLTRSSALIFKGDGGECEIRPEARTRYWRVRDGQIDTLTWPRQTQSKCDAPPDPERLRALWREGHPDDPLLPAVLGTLGISLMLLESLDSPDEALTHARALWDARDRQRLD